GAASRYLGLLGFTMSRLDDSARHFADALEMNERMGAKPFVAHVQHEYARTLLARGGPGDREKAEALLERASATARDLGMNLLARKISTLQAPVERSLNENLFRRDGGLWTIAYDGKLSRLRHNKGFLYIAYLLGHPSADLPAADLAAAAGEAGFAPSRAASSDQARVNVTKAIKGAIRRISAANPSLGRVLERTIRTGKVFSYDPDPHSPIRWNP
ncbi:MAG: hypothetical protein ACREQ9_17140, partial [Candidatus Binatia bacterium]